MLGLLLLLCALRDNKAVGKHSGAVQRLPADTLVFIWGNLVQESSLPSWELCEIHGSYT